MSFIVNINGKPQIFMSGYDLGSYGRAYALGAESDVIDVTAFADSARRKVLGNQQVTIRYDGLFDAGTPYLAVRDLMGSARTITIWPDGLTVGGTGAGLAQGFVNQYRPEGNMGEILSLGFDITSDAQFDVVYAYDTKVATSTTGQYTSPTYDKTVASTAGGVFFVHIFTCSASGGNTRWTLRWQDSTADVSGDFAAVSGISAYQANSGTILSAYQTSTGSVLRYNRFRASLDASSGNITFVAGFGAR